MNTIDDAVCERHLEETLRELLPPSRIAAPPPSRRSPARFGKAALMAMAVAVVAYVALLADGSPPSAERRVPPPWRQDAIVPPIDAVVVRTAADIEALPLTTRGVACRRLPADAFAALRRLPQLESLVISGEMDGDGLFFVRYPLPGTAVEQFEHLPRLRRVRFVAVDDVDARALHALQALPILEELHLRQVDEVDDGHVAAIAELPRLRRLWLESRGALTDRGLGRLLEALPLEELYLRGTFELTADGYRQLATEHTLRTLDLTAPWHVAAREQLERLPWPDETTEAVDDRVLAAIASLTELRTLRLGSRRAVTDAGLAALANLEQLTSIDFAQCYGITSAGLAKLPRTHLRELVLRECPGITELPGPWPQLRRLDLRFCPRIDDRTVAMLKHVPELEQLVLSDCPLLTPRCLDDVVGHESLRVLHLEGHAWLDDDALRQLATLAELRELHLGSYLDRCNVPTGDGESGGPTKITGAGVMALRGMRHLAALNLNAAQPIDVAALRTLSGLPLRELSLCWAMVGYDDETDGLDALRRLWPDAKVTWYPIR